MTNRFSLKDKVVVITGGSGLLGVKHAEAVAEVNGIPVLFDLNGDSAKRKANHIRETYHVDCLAFQGDVTQEDSVREMARALLDVFGHVDVLINNAAMNPKMETGSSVDFTRMENYSIDGWNQEIAVGLTGAFICSKIFGTIMAEQNAGTILNISSDLGVIAPDQRLYAKEGLPCDKQPVKPVTYSVIKHALIGLTKYLATYWADKGVRANSLCPGGVYVNQPDDFVQKLTHLIPLGRMASSDEYMAAVQFLCSDASAYMNGACIVMDGGRSCW